MKKQTNWITIPEEAIHTPASGSGASKKGMQKQETKPVKNKLLWGIGFIFIIFVTFALLAPNQFNTLLRGSLFEAAEMPEEEFGKPINPLVLLGGETQKEEEEEEEEVVEEEEEDEVVEEEGGVFESEPVVQPEEEAVSISIEPISTPEPIDTPPTPVGAQHDVPTSEGMEDQPTDQPTAEPEPTVQEELIDELQKQIDQLQEQREMQTQALQDLTNIVQEQKEEELHPAAVPPSITSTTIIAQPSAMQPVFRPNTHVAGISPEEMLRQNKTLGVQYAQQTIPTQQVYQARVITAEKTPDTGPSEIMLIAFLVAFLSLAGWKFVKIFA